MARYSVWIVSPPRYLHSRCFEEVALALESGLKSLGHSARVTTDPRDIDGRAIVLGANLLPHYRDTALPQDMILYNLEQIQPGSPWLRPSYLALLKQFTVWDYSAQNISALAALDIHATLCGIGYAPELTRIAPATKDIDLLFIGSMNARRKQVLDALMAQGVKVEVRFGLYGHERDALIARAKILLNLHFYEARVFEIVRVSYLLANRICVVSESGLDAAMEQPLAEGVAFAPYEQLATKVTALLADNAAREVQAERGFELFSQQSQAAMVARALAAA